MHPSTTDPDGMAVPDACGAATSGRRTIVLGPLPAENVRLLQSHRGAGACPVERPVRMAGAARMLELLAAEGC